MALKYTKMCGRAFLPKQVSTHALKDEQPKEGKKKISKDTQTAFYTSKMFGLR